MKFNLRFSWIFSGVLILLILLAACAPVKNVTPTAVSTPEPTEPSYPAPLEYSGSGGTSLEAGSWTGPALLHIQAEKSVQPLTISLDGRMLINAAEVGSGTAVNEYRGYVFGSSGRARLKVDGSQNWKVTVLPPSAKFFPVIKIPGYYEGQGSQVILLRGVNGIAIFSSSVLDQLNAWSYGKKGELQKLSFRTEKDFSGRAVLPEGAAWIIVSAPGKWSVEVQSPCCVLPPGVK
jgi:hypothetical protein